MTVQEILAEVVTLPEAVSLAASLGYRLDRSNLLRHAQSGRLVARKSAGAWLTPRSAVQELVAELSLQTRGRPRPETPDWADVELSPEIQAQLDEIARLRDRLYAIRRPAAEQERLVRELTVEAIYHTNHIEGNELTLGEVRAIVEALWAQPAQASA